MGGADGARVAELEAKARALHKQAQRLNSEGRVAEATAAYQAMQAADDEALHLALAAAAPPGAPPAAHAAAYSAYCATQVCSTRRVRSRIAPSV